MRHREPTPTRAAPTARRRSPAPRDTEARGRKGTDTDLVQRLDGPADASARDDAVELRIGILLWPRFPLLSLAGLCDALRHAADLGDQSRQVRCSWSVLGLPGGLGRLGRYGRYGR
jgi:hypothetical protein